METPKLGFSEVAPLSLQARMHSTRLRVAAMLALSGPALWLVWTAILVWSEDLSGVGVLPVFEAEQAWPLAGWATLASIALMAWSGWRLVRRQSGSGMAGTAGAILALVPISWYASDVPVVAMVAWAWAAGLIFMLGRVAAWPSTLRPKDTDHQEAVEAPAVLVIAGGSLLLVALAEATGVTQDVAGEWAAALVLVVGSALTSIAEWALWKKQRLPTWLSLVLGGATVVGATLILWPGADFSVTRAGWALLTWRLILGLSGAAISHELRGDLLRALWARPTLLVVLTFALLSFLGGLVLCLPISNSDALPLDFIDGLFTAVSACCVTGLIVVDTGTAFSPFGQVVILLLIQIGALGIMTLAALTTLLLAGNLGSNKHNAIAEVVGGDSPAGTKRLIRTIAIATFSTELLGACFLFPVFFDGGNALEAVWKSGFHSISAFCNAGFALQGDSVVSLQSSGYAMHVLSLLIVLGGLGFGVMAGLMEVARRKSRPNLHLKIVLSTNLVLWLLAYVGWMVFEWRGALDGLSLGDKLNNAWFQTATLRTAGFNSVDFGGLAPPTILMSLVMMFIGASPGSTGGGIKTTTVAVLFLAIFAVVRNRSDADAFGRRIPASVVYRAAAVATISALFVLFGAIGLMMTQEIPFDRTLFEAVSAFGTVGLSMGITAELDQLGRLIIIFLMFVGRTGPLTMVLLFRRKESAPLGYPVEEVMVG